VSAYLLSKVLVLAPVLTAVAAILLTTLHVLDRLPPTTPTGLASLLGILVLESLAALALGLLTSTLVREASQATLALPMLCFPQVLFAGAVVPVAALTAPGHLLSYVLINRWAFEAIGRGLALSKVPAAGAHGSAFTGTSATGSALLGVATVVLLGLAAVALRQSTPRPRR
jgi:ABC transport system ATP-binding/permease protein